jgi:hypothetical protein
MSVVEPVSHETRKVSIRVASIQLWHRYKQMHMGGKQWEDQLPHIAMCSNRSILRIDRLWCHCWGSMQITKIYYLRNPELPKIYLCSNAVTIKGDAETYPRRPNTGITLPHKRWRWRWHSRPQGREYLDATTPVQQHRWNDIVPHVQHLVVLVHVQCMMTPSGSRIQPRLRK